jgi:hypothetical protein
MFPSTRTADTQGTVSLKKKKESVLDGQRKWRTLALRPFESTNVFYNSQDFLCLCVCMYNSQDFYVCMLWMKLFYNY